MSCLAVLFVAAGCSSDLEPGAPSEHVGGTATTSSTGGRGPTSGGGGAGGSIATGDVWYVAPDGNDSNGGSVDAPFGTIQHAIDLAAPGDTIYLRGGTFMLSSTVVIEHAGLEGAPTRLWAYAGETPILDFSQHPRHQDPPNPQIGDDSITATGDAHGLLISGDSAWWHLRGLTLRHAPYYGVRVYGSHHVFERLVLHDNGASGLEITGKDGFSPSDNLVVNSDSFHNFDRQNNGENADGFAAKFEGVGPNNVFRGLRAWSNADDGYDFWHVGSSMLIEACWAFDNGYNRPEWANQLSGGWSGDGLGFKLGQDAAELTLRRVAAWGNKSFGIDDNGNSSPGGLRIEHATLVNNGKDGHPVQISLDDGAPHHVVNSVAFDVDGPGPTSFSGPVQDQNNAWAGVSASDFVDLDMANLLSEGSAPRGTAGVLPDLGLRLQPQSSLVDGGVDLGLVFNGSAPDLGAFETP